MARLRDRQQSHFTDRIKRIEKGGPNTSATVYAGVDEQHHRRRRRRKKRDLQSPSLGAQLFMMPFALLIGASVMFLGRMSAFHALAAEDFITVENATIFALTADVAIAAVLGTVLVALFSLGRGMRLVCFMAGFIAVMLGEASMIKQAPDFFVGLYSPAYVEEAVARAPEDPFSPEAFGL